MYRPLKGLRRICVNNRLSAFSFHRAILLTMTPNGRRASHISRRDQNQAFHISREQTLSMHPKILHITKHFVSNFLSETPLTVAAVKKNANEVIMFLINGGAYFDFKNRNGLTAVHRAAIAGNSHNIKVI